MIEETTDGQQYGQPETEGQPLPEPKLTAGELCKKILREALDLLKGAAFPFIVMCVFSTTIILFSEYDDIAVQIIATVFGEGLLVAAFVMFGKQNGAAAYRCKCVNEGKRKLGTSDLRILWRTGEYAPWKGFVIGFITSLLFIIFQIIACFGDYSFVQFMLDYACGWAVAPFNLIGNIPQPYYLFMIVFPIGIHGGFYIFGRYSEEKRQAKIARAEDDKRKGKKKHYYEENERSYERGGRASRVDMSSEKRKNGKKK